MISVHLQVDDEWVMDLSENILLIFDMLGLPHLDNRLLLKNLYSYGRR